MYRYNFKLTERSYIEIKSIVVNDETSDTEGDEDNDFHTVYGSLRGKKPKMVSKEE